MPDDLEEAKRRLRREMTRRRRAVDPAAAQAAAAAVAEALAACESFRAAPRVALYAALPDELPSRPLFEAVRAAGKTALLPRQEAAGLVFRTLFRWDELRPGSHAVLEPPSDAPAVTPGSGDLVLVPGVAFDAAGHRLGRGGGAYDRAFPVAVTGPLLFGVGYAFQQVDAVPHDSRDRRMDAIVTERGVHRAGSDG